VSKAIEALSLPMYGGNYTKVQVWNTHIDRIGQNSNVDLYGDDNLRSMTEPLNRIWGMKYVDGKGELVDGPRKQFWELLGYEIKEVRLTNDVAGHTWLGCVATWVVTRDGRRILVPVGNVDKLLISMTYKVEQAYRRTNGWLEPLDVIEDYRKDLYWNKFWYGVLTEFLLLVRDWEFKETGRLFKYREDHEIEEIYLSSG
jgi:hypothetical protein